MISKVVNIVKEKKCACETDAPSAFICYCTARRRRIGAIVNAYAANLQHRRHHRVTDIAGHLGRGNVAVRYYVEIRHPEA